MRRIQISVADLVAVVLAASLGLAALRTPSYYLANLIFTVAAAMAAFATLAAMTRRGDRRAPWSGFAVFAWAYLYLSMGPWERTYIPPALGTSNALDLAQPYIAPQLKATPNPNYRGWTRETDYLAYRQVGHSLGAILAGWAGSLCGRWLVESGRRPRDE